MKTIWSIYLPLFLLSQTSCMKYAQPEIHLIPEGFIGEVIITFNVPGKGTLDKEEDQLVFYINSNGRCETQDPPNLGIRPHDTGTFYYVNSTGERTQLPMARNHEGEESAIVVSDLYVVKQRFHYFIDTPSNIANYPNPGIDEHREENGY